MATGNPPGSYLFNASYSSGITVNSSAFFGAGFADAATNIAGDNIFAITSAGSNATITVGGSIGSAGAGATNGIKLKAGGTVLVVEHGQLAHQYNNAIMADAAATIINVGTVASSGTNSGAATIRLNQGGQIINAAGARIEGPAGAIAGGQAVFVINSGSIKSSAGIAIAAAGASTIMNSQGATVSGKYGVYLSGNGTVDNFGSIVTTGFGVGLERGGTAFNTGSIASQVGVLLGTGSALNNGGSGKISAQATAVEAGQNACVSNSGVVASKAGTAVSFYGTGTLTNLTAGTVSAGTYGVSAAGGAVSIMNMGAIAGAYAGADLLVGGTVTNLASGTISGDRCGILLNGASGSVVNAGSIGASGAYVALSPSASYYVSVGAGVVLLAGASLTNQYGGRIHGSSYGVLVHNAGSLLLNQGTITSPNVGVELDGGDSFTNSAAGSVTGNYAVYGNGNPATIVYAGKITGTGSPGAGIYLWAGGAVTNQASGTITGGLYGVFSKASAAVVNAGSISGATGVWLASGGTLVDSGTISGTKQAVVIKGTGTLVLDPGATFTGAVNGVGSGTRVVELASTAWAGTVGSIGTAASGASINGFSQVKVDAGAHWTLLGNAPMVFLGGGGDWLTVGSSANVNITAGVGADTIMLGAGVANVTEAKGSTAGDTIMGFTGSDVIHFTGFGAGAAVTALGGDVYWVGTAASSETLTVYGASLSAAAHNYTVS